VEKDAGQWLAWADRRVPLHEGDQIVGRDISADIPLPLGVATPRVAEHLEIRRRIADGQTLAAAAACASGSPASREDPRGGPRYRRRDAC
jgi:hypothetical protein